LSKETLHHLVSQRHPDSVDQLDGFVHGLSLGLRFYPIDKTELLPESQENLRTSLFGPGLFHVSECGKFSFQLRQGELSMEAFQ